MREVTNRMVLFWVNALYEEGLIEQSDKQIIYDELVYMLLMQIFAPNSPQWFNTGLFDAYGISGKSEGHFFYDEEIGEVRLSDNAYQRTQGSACFILGVKDSLFGDKSLTDTIKTETLLFKYGSGVGSNWSSIRAKGEELSGGGKSSGLLSFLKVFDRNAGAIKSGGTTRRAAKMNILNLDHPEIIDFINWKSLEEDKACALGKLGYSTDMEGEAYETVSGQNVNNSCRIPDVFMQMIKINSRGTQRWGLKGRNDEQADSEIDAKELWNEIAKAAWHCGDPGVQYDDTINAWHTCPYGEDGDFLNNRINASNPCSEFLFLDDTACNLASINILKFYSSDSQEFDIEGYMHSIFLIQLILEATIYKGNFPTRDIARRSYKFRATGLGLTNLGALFMSIGIPYDSDEARNLAAGVTSLLTGYSYYTSAMMAEKIGPFECYDINAEAMKRVLRNHARAAEYDEYDIDYEYLNYEPLSIKHKILSKIGMPNLSGAIKETWKNALALGEFAGYRNAQVAAMAPTGTISFAMDCAATSAEPFYSHITYKKLSGGGSMDIINPYTNLKQKHPKSNSSRQEI